MALASGLAGLLVLMLGGLRSVGVLVTGLLGAMVALVGSWWFLSRRGPERWLGAGFAIAAPVFVIVIYVAARLLWAVALSIALFTGAAVAVRRAQRGTAPSTGVHEIETAPPRRPFLLMNSRSGGGKVGRFALDRRAAELGADVVALDGSVHQDVAALARRAVAGGADLLGVAGGDGTQALVAGVAAEHDVPFLVISAGTRNHFAMDLGLDRDRPDTGLDALREGVELRIDLGWVNGRTFVNNASFGAYAEVVQSPAYRHDKRGTTLQMLPDLLAGHRGPRLVATVDGGTTIEACTALLVSNNPYDFRDLAGLGRRARLDTGSLGVIAATVHTAAQAADLVRGRHGTGLRRLVATEVVVDADVPEIPVGIDGEAVMMPTPLRCRIRPRALRVRVPRTRPGVPASPAAIDLLLLLRQALPSPREDRSAGVPR